jgi:hypothetical protein
MPTALFVDNDSGKERLVPKGFELRAHIALPLGGQIDVGDETIGEGEPKAVAAPAGDSRDLIRRSHGGGSIESPDRAR